MQKGQMGSYRDNQSQAWDATVTRSRGGNRVDIDVDGHHLQMVPVGDGAEHFWPHGHDPEDAPPPKSLARMVPRYIPTWHAVVLGVPVAAGTAALFEVLFHWLGRP